MGPAVWRPATTQPSQPPELDEEKFNGNNNPHNAFLCHDRHIFNLIIGDRCWKRDLCRFSDLSLSLFGLESLSSQSVSVRLLECASVMFSSLDLPPALVVFLFRRGSAGAASRVSRRIRQPDQPSPGASSISDASGAAIPCSGAHHASSGSEQGTCKQRGAASSLREPMLAANAANEVLPAAASESDSH